VSGAELATNYTSTELLAVLFARISQLADRFVGSHVIDCVIAVPHWLDQSTRAELTLAAEVAGLKVLALQSDLAAVAMHYAMNRRAETEDSAHVLFVDQGETHAQFGVVTFARDLKNKKGNHFSAATVKSVEWVEVGGRDLDNAILQHVISKYGVQGLEDRPRTLALARKQMKRAKEVLTANKEAHFTVRARAQRC
jgi:molecular chaperone DnaK (HSP70)